MIKSFMFVTLLEDNYDILTSFGSVYYKYSTNEHILEARRNGMQDVNKPTQMPSEWVSSFLMAHQHILCYSVPFIHSVLSYAKNITLRNLPWRARLLDCCRTTDVGQTDTQDNLTADNLWSAQQFAVWSDNVELQHRKYSRHKIPV